MNIGVILAAGDSSRFGGYVNKQYLKLNGKEVVYYTISKMRECEEIDKVILVVDKQEYDSRYIQDKYNVECVCGGASRNQSIYNVIKYINDNYSCNNIVFVDSARPLLNDSMINSGLNCLETCSGVITCQHITDSLGDENGLVNRDNYYLIQTPEMFKFKSIVTFDKDSQNTAIYKQAEGEIKKNFITDSNIKLTYSSDLSLLQKLLF